MPRLTLGRKRTNGLSRVGLNRRWPEAATDPPAQEFIYLKDRRQAHATLVQICSQRRRKLPASHCNRVPRASFPAVNFDGQCSRRDKGEGQITRAIPPPFAIGGSCLQCQH